MEFIEYPEEDLYEDGELTKRQVEQKIIEGWYNESIILTRIKENRNEQIKPNYRLS